MNDFTKETNKRHTLHTSSTKNLNAANLMKEKQNATRFFSLFLLGMATGQKTRASTRHERLIENVFL